MLSSCFKRLTSLRDAQRQLLKDAQYGASSCGQNVLGLQGLAQVGGKRSDSYLVEATSVIIAVVDAHLTPVDASVASNAEVVWHEWAAISLQSDVSLQEVTLRQTCVDLLGLGHHDGLVFQEVEDGDPADSEIFEPALSHVFLEVGLEAQDL